MAAPSSVNSTSGITSFDTSNLTTSAISVTSGNLLVAIVSTFNNNPASLTYSDSASNSYTARGSTYLDPYGLRVLTATASSSTSITFTANKGGSTCSVAIAWYEVSGWVAGPTDPGDATFASGASGTDSSVTMGSATTVAADLLFTFLVTRETAQVTAGSPNTTNATFVNSLNPDSSGGFMQLKTATATTSTTNSFTGGWPSMTNSNSRPWRSGIIAIKGSVDSSSGPRRLTLLGVG